MYEYLTRGEPTRIYPYRAAKSASNHEDACKRGLGQLDTEGGVQIDVLVPLDERRCGVRL